MFKVRWYLLGLVALLGLSVAACGGTGSSAEPDRIATRVAEEQAVAATLTAAAPPPPTEAAATAVPPTVAPSPTEPPEVEPTATEAQPPTTAVQDLTPSPTPVLVAVLPVDGGGADQLNIRNNNPVKDGRNVTLPGFAPDEVSEPMVFRDRMVFQVEVSDRNVGTGDGEGINSVTFAVTDDRGEPVHFQEENNAGYCVFGGGEPDCNVLNFEESHFRWPGGDTLYPVLYSVSIDIQPYSGDTVNWLWSFRVELPHDAARIDNISVQNGYYVIDFEAFGFTPELPGQHLHFFFDTVPTDQAGVPGSGPWKIYGGASPFTEYAVSERPSGAENMCVLVANPDHTIQPDTGNCFPLP
jgi:hypothetical protein